MAFSVFGVKFRIEFAFLLIILVSGLLGNSNILWLILFSSLHESGHIIVLLLFGGRIDEITVSYYGIGMKHSSQLRPLQEAVFLLAGVIVNTAFALVNVHRDINLALAFVNLLPVYPLDGGRVLNIIFVQLFSYSTAYKLSIAISFAVTVSLLAVALVFGNISLLLIVLYIMFYYINFRGMFNEKRG